MSKYISISSNNSGNNRGSGNDNIDLTERIVFAKLTDVSNTLRKTCLNFNVGAQVLTTAQPKTLIKWHTYEKWLKAQITECEEFTSRNNIEKMTPILLTNEDIAKRESELQQNIAKLQEELFQLSSENLKNELLIKRISQNKISINYVFPDKKNKQAKKTR